MNFVTLMNSKRFHPTNDQMVALEETTKAIIGVKCVSIFLLSNLQPNIGFAEFVKDNIRYKAARLHSNGRWYLTGDYTY